MVVRCFTIPHPRAPMMSLWRVEVDRPDDQGGPFYHEFKGDDLFRAAQMANKWRLK